MKRGERGYRLLLRWAALPVTDRRWGAILAAVALGLGLFVGVAIGPGASGTFAGGVPQVIEVAGLGGADVGGEEEATGFEAVQEGGFEAEQAEPGAAGSEFEFAEAEPEGPFEAPSEEPASPPAQESKPAEDVRPEEDVLTLGGTVVHVNPAAGSYTVGAPSGALSAVHATKLPPPGAKLSVSARTLANGTFAEAEPAKKSGTATTAKLEGIVTWVDADPAAPAYALSKRGVSLLVKVRPDPAGAPPQLPVLGAFARVGVEIEALATAPETPATPETPAAAPLPPQPVCEGVPLAAEQLPRVPPPVAVLWQTSIDASGVPFTYSDIAGVVTAVCVQEKTLILSADDLRAAGSDLTIAVPPKLATAELKPGDSVLATADVGAAGELTLKGLANDERTKGADDADSTQGDLVNHLDG